VSTPPHDARPADRTIRAGVAVFVAGLLFIAADVVPYFAGAANRPLWLNLSCLLAPLGFAIVVGSALRRGRAEQRAALRAVDDRDRRAG
jgi:uncharacterized membrane protein YhdT